MDMGLTVAAHMNSSVGSEHRNKHFLITARGGVAAIGGKHPEDIQPRKMMKGFLVQLASLLWFCRYGVGRAVVIGDVVMPAVARWAAFQKVKKVGWEGDDSAPREKSLMSL